MKFELLEVAGTHIFSMKAMTLVLFFIFAIIVVGYLVGKISIKGVSLGRRACRQLTTILSWCRIWGWFCL